MQTEIPFVGGAYTGRSTNINAQECINLFPVVDNTGAKSSLALLRCPGLTEFADLNTASAVRGMTVVDTYIYCVSGKNVYRIDGSGVVGKIGEIITTSGDVYFEHNINQLMIIDSLYGYIYAFTDGTGMNVNQITDADFPTPSHLTYQDGYFIVSAADTDRIYISSLLDGTAWDALDYATAETRPDAIVAIISNNREVRIFGKSTLENWYNNGVTDFPFERIAGSTQDIGTIATGSVAIGDSAVLFMGIRGQIWKAQTYAPEKISQQAPAIEYQIAELDQKSDARAFVYVNEGHTFYVLTFPNDDKTFVYDLTTGFWHKRSTGNAEGRWRANCHAFFGDANYVGDYSNGKVYKIDQNAALDDDEEIRWTRTAQHISNSGKLLYHDSLEILFEPGHAEAGVDNLVGLSWSDDGGHNWSNEHIEVMGKTGEYGKRIIWNRLGSSRDRIYKITGGHAAKTVILGAYLNFREGVS